MNKTSTPRTDVPEGKEVLITVTCDPELAKRDASRKKLIVILSVVGVLSFGALVVWFGASDEERIVYIVLGFMGLVGILRVANRGRPFRSAEALQLEWRRERMGLPKELPPAPAGYCDITADTLYFSFRTPVPVSDITSVVALGATLTLRRMRRGYKAIHLRGVDHPKEFAELLTNLISTFDPRTGKPKL